MTLLKAMLTLKEKGATYLTGEDGDCDIDTCISIAIGQQRNLSSLPDNYFIAEIEGHYVIATANEGLNTAT